MLSKKQQLEQAKRALAEAQKRRELSEIKQRQEKKFATPEIGGRGGQDPVRYGDWELKGRAIDF